MTNESLTYADSGVDYGALDYFKRKAQQAARSTAGNLARFGLEELEWSRGESAFLFTQGKSPRNTIWAHVHEGLGTKNLVAQSMQALTGNNYYRAIAQDTIATGINDIITLGALPVSVSMHLAVGDSSWLDDTARVDALLDGWKQTCIMARCTWSGGETPTLKGIILPSAAELSCSVIGIVRPESRLIRCNIADGDSIVLIRSSGIHANGLSLARHIAGQLPAGYLTNIENGTAFGETLLTPTTIYSPIMEACLDARIPIHYAVNMTGHGWLKLMRAPLCATYVIERVPEPHAVFSFMMEKGPISVREAYSTFNMGAGFALVLPPDYASTVVSICSQHEVEALAAGYVKDVRPSVSSQMSRLSVLPLAEEFVGETLTVR